MAYRSIALLVMGVVGLLAPAPARAQQRLFALTSDSLTEIDSSPAALGRVLASRPVPPLSEVGPVNDALTAGAGRYVVWGTSYGYIFAYDVVADQLLTLGGPGALPGARGSLLGTDASGNTLVYLARTSTTPGEPPEIALVDLTTQQTRYLAPARRAGYSAYALAPGAGKIFALWSQGANPLMPPPSRAVDVIDLATGQVQEGVFDVPYGGCQGIGVDSAGTRLWAAVNPNYAYTTPSGHAAFDAASGGLLAFNPLSPITMGTPASCPSATLLVDDARNLLLTVTDQGLAAMDASSLRVLGTADTPRFDLQANQIPQGWNPWFDYQVLAAPTASAIYTLAESGINYSYHESRCVQGSLVALSPATGARLGTRSFTGCPAQRLALSSAPAAPTAVAAAVDGSHVTLTWTAPAQTVSYQIEAGTAMGLANLVRTSVDAPTFGVEGVPPGTYYVRVRAINWAGRSLPSSDVQVIVP